MPLARPAKTIQPEQTSGILRVINELLIPILLYITEPAGRARRTGELYSAVSIRVTLSQPARDLRRPIEFRMRLLQPALPRKTSEFALRSAGLRIFTIHTVKTYLSQR